MWNPHCRQRQNAGPLEELIEKYELLVNNDTDYATCPLSSGISIIDLALTNPEFGLLRVWEIPEEYPSLSDHEMILLDWKDLPADRPAGQAAMTGWNNQRFLEDKHLLQATQED